MTFFTLTSTFIEMLPLILITFCSSNLHLHLHDVCFVNIFDSCITVIMLHKLTFKSSVLFGAHTSLDKSLKVLKLATDLSNLTTNG